MTARKPIKGMRGAKKLPVEEYIRQWFKVRKNVHNLPFIPTAYLIDGKVVEL